VTYKKPTGGREFGMSGCEERASGQPACSASRRSSDSFSPVMASAMKPTINSGSVTRCSRPTPGYNS
jgi:hypothetical protein